MPSARRMDGEAAPSHARHLESLPDLDSEVEPAEWEPEPDDLGPAHFEGGRGTGDGRPPRRRWPGWLIPVVACVVALTCIVAIAIPASLLNDSPEADALADALVPEEPIPAAIATAFGEAVGAVPDLSAMIRAGADVEEAVRAIEATGYRVGYDVTTSDGREVLALNADESFYGASAIKGPFVLRAFADGVPGVYRGLVEDAIQWSDNDSYFLLREERGYDVLEDQLVEVGAGGLTPTMSFVWMTPRQLAELWVLNLGALEVQGEAGDWLRQTFTGTLNSAIAALPSTDNALSSAYGKAGWIDTEDLHSTTDAGTIAVRGEDGRPDRRYVLAVMTDKGEDFDAIANVVNALAAYLQARPDMS